MYKRIVIRMPNWIGDLVMATPILHDIRSAFPNAHIVVVCVASIASILEKDPNINGLITFRRAKSKLSHFNGDQVVSQIREGEFDVAISLTNSTSSARWFQRAGVKKRLGFSHFLRRPFLNLAVQYPDTIEEQHLVLTYKHLLKRIGLPPTSSLPRLYVSSDEKKSARQLVHTIPSQKWVGINPGAAYGTAKCWLPDRFQQVAKQLIEEDEEVVVLFFSSLDT